jgi:hypothetical protein
LFCAKCGKELPTGAIVCPFCGTPVPGAQAATNQQAGGTGQTPPPAAPPMAEAKAAGFQMSTAFGDAIALATNPVAFMTKNKDLSVAVNTIMVNYVAILAVIPFIATLIGPLWYYHYSFLVGYAFTLAVLTYIFDVVAVYVVGYLIWKLAPTFGATTDQKKGTLLAAWIFTPAFLISILNIIPFIGWISFLGLLYGLYILYLGLPILTNTPKDRVMSYLVGVVVATIIVYAIVGAIVGAVTTAIFLTSFGFY